MSENEHLEEVAIAGDSGAESSAEKNVLVPLTFPQQTSKNTADLFNLDDETVECMLCCKEFKMQIDQQAFLHHLFVDHRLVIGDVSHVASLKSYVNFWKVRMRSGPLEEFCSVMKMDVTPDGQPSKDETYFLLSDILPEDKLLREGLQEKRLNAILERQKFEREDQSYSRDCLFCRFKLGSTRADALKHLSDKHNLNLGRPDNLVFIDELLEKIHTRLENLRCLFCNNLFLERHILREHMRKKQHKCINPNDTEFDKYYIVNYLEIGKTWKEVEEEQDGPTGAEEESWSDWCEEDEAAKLTCLFCDHQAKHLQALNCHSQVQHDGFSLENINLSFYLQVKLVNYIRRQVHMNACPVCNEQFPSKIKLVEHLQSERHYTLPEESLFDQPQYFFPTYEDDAVLFQLEDAGETECQSPVIPE
ncbi:zinc finger protein 277 [Neocloeon triangulifer]|uniref:zinc finger protein 277 n=1 Tax=Neocloeon triangulifer TaxID=2078957 RepID=UPI00286F53CD|nr:zinc finger protein 277 [Neocloeon triangulifer]